MEPLTRLVYQATMDSIGQFFVWGRSYFIYEIMILLTSFQFLPSISIYSFSIYVKRNYSVKGQIHRNTSTLTAACAITWTCLWIRVISLSHIVEPNWKKGNKIVLNFAFCLYSKRCRNLLCNSNYPVSFRILTFFVAIGNRHMTWLSRATVVESCSPKEKLYRLSGSWNTSLFEISKEVNKFLSTWEMEFRAKRRQISKPFILKWTGANKR